jgi:hypothetical protein
MKKRRNWLRKEKKKRLKKQNVVDNNVLELKLLIFQNILMFVLVVDVEEDVVEDVEEIDHLVVLKVKNKLPLNQVELLVEDVEVVEVVEEEIEFQRRNLLFLHLVLLLLLLLKLPSSVFDS